MANEFEVYAFVKKSVAENPELISAVISGALAGQQEKIKSMQEEMSWANMATDMALTIAMGKRVTQGHKEIAEHVVRERLKRFGENMNGIEFEFLSRDASRMGE